MAIGQGRRLQVDDEDLAETAANDQLTFQINEQRHRLSQALMFLQTARMTLPSDAYDKLLNIMRDAQRRDITIPQCVIRIGVLLRNYRDLIERFNRFTPDGTSVSCDGDNIYIHTRGNQPTLIPPMYTWDNYPYHLEAVLVEQCNGVYYY